MDWSRNSVSGARSKVEWNSRTARQRGGASRPFANPVSRNRAHWASERRVFFGAVSSRIRLPGSSECSPLSISTWASSWASTTSRSRAPRTTQTVSRSSGRRAAVAAADGLGVERRVLARAVDEVDRRRAGAQLAREFARRRRVEDPEARLDVDAHQLRLARRDPALREDLARLAPRPSSISCSCQLPPAKCTSVSRRTSGACACAGRAGSSRSRSRTRRICEIDPGIV